MAVMAGADTLPPMFVHQAGSLRPSDSNYPDFAEVPDAAHFVGINTSLVVWALSAVVVCMVMWVLYKRYR